jgi:hypothetical protein
MFQLYRGGQFYWCSNRCTQKKTTDLSQVTDKIYHIMLGRVQKDITQIFIDVCLTSSDKSFHTYAGHEQVMIYLENYTAMKEPTGSTTFDFYW